MMDLAGHLAQLVGLPMSQLAETHRALREESKHFAPADESERLAAEEAENPHDADVLRGRPGPGGGVDADPFRAAFFLASIMINAPRREIANKTWSVWHLPQAGSELSGWGDGWKPTFAYCPLTGKFLFGDAMKAVLEDCDLARRVRKLHVRSVHEAEIEFDDGASSKFVKSAGETPLLTRTATLDGLVLSAVSQLIRRER